MCHDLHSFLLEVISSLSIGTFHPSTRAVTPRTAWSRGATAASPSSHGRNPCILGHVLPWGLIWTVHSTIEGPPLPGVQIDCESVYMRRALSDGLPHVS